MRSTNERTAIRSSDESSPLGGHQAGDPGARTRLGYSRPPRRAGAKQGGDARRAAWLSARAAAEERPAYPSAGRCHDGLHAGFFFNDTATTEIYTLSLHDALPI